MTDPTATWGRKEWQDAVDAAVGFLALEQACRAGTVKCDIPVNVEQAVATIKAGRERGVHPSPDAPQKLIAALVKAAKEG